MEKLFIVKVGNEKYLADKFYFLRLKRLRISIISMKSTIKEYFERIEVKQKFINDTLKEVKDKCQKKI